MTIIGAIAFALSERHDIRHQLLNEARESGLPGGRESEIKNGVSE
ncbi:hypothetical protein [Paraburkholderia sp. BCC1884]|nr:hypothetical protein [Paraburkholderia sp. BCC1884]